MRDDYHPRGERRMSQDPEVRRLVKTTTHAYAVAETLAEELNKTVSTLQAFMRDKPPMFDMQQEEPRERNK